jgi:hypothetical protein
MVGETQPWVSVADRRLVARWVAARCLGRATVRDGDGEVLRDPWLEKKKKNKQTNKPWVYDTWPEKQTDGRRVPTARSGKVRLPRPPARPTSFFFLFSLFLVENQVLLGVDFFVIFFSLTKVSYSYWWA